MKRFNIIKTIQLIVMLAVLVGCAAAILTDRELFHDVAHHSGLRLLALCLWIVFGVSFFFLFLDFSNLHHYKRDYRELDYAVHSDPLSGLANRNSCDAIIEQYQDKPLPRDVGCVTLVLRNIRRINEGHGYAKGNEVIREFSTILKLSSVSLCFVGRNGGNKFLAIFEQTRREDIDRFLERVERKVAGYNQRNPDHTIEYSFGVAFEEPGGLKINELVALSDRRACG
ncbi:MAG: diguanylate cyclase [Clostridia bacterium]|nr:diguanylate cyclase [Clostridia bacterium]